MTRAAAAGSMGPMTGRIALITGGTRGIGRAIAEALARAGHALALVYCADADAADEARATLGAAGARVHTVAADIARPGEAERAVREVEAALGAPTILVNNAFRGGRPPLKTHEVAAEHFAEDLSTNVGGPFLVTRAVLPRMVEAGFGRIVFVGSLAARGEPGRVAYATAKAALTGLSGTIAQEYARHGVTSNVVNPGFIAAGAFERLPEDIRARALRSVPSRRAGAGEEVAALVTHLCSEAAGYLTAQVIGVDGGAR